MKRRHPLYGYRWEQARKAFLARHPLCADHQRLGHVVAATVVDHIKPHRGDPVLFWDQTNWQPLCTPCHNIHKQSLEKGGRPRGCDADGTPLDPDAI